MNSEEIARIVQEELLRPSQDEGAREEYARRLEEDQETDAIVDEVLQRKGRR